MEWGGNNRVIIHIDGDSFFAACEIAKDPKLRGKPVVTGKERGIVSAASYEAKRLGITRGVALKEVKKICPETVILASDFATYGMYAHRLYAIVRRYTPLVEEYGIDECFADITDSPYRKSHSGAEIAQMIQEDLYRELRIGFSIGVGPTKVLAKIGSKHRKPRGLVVITPETWEAILAETSVRNVWGIGPSMALKLYKRKIDTALDFARASEGTLDGLLDKPHRALWRELRGEQVLALNTVRPDAPYSIQTTRTFTPPSRDRAFILSQLSMNVETALRKARRIGRAPSRVYFHLKSQSFEYQGTEVLLPLPSVAPQDIVPRVLRKARQIMHPGIEYRATGVTLADFASEEAVQLDLWNESTRTERLRQVYNSIDHLTERYGTPLVHLASSMHAREHEAQRRARLMAFSSVRPIIRGLGRKRLPLPVLGEVS